MSGLGQTVRLLDRRRTAGGGTGTVAAFVPSLLPLGPSPDVLGGPTHPEQGDEDAEPLTGALGKLLPAWDSTVSCPSHHSGSRGCLERSGSLSPDTVHFAGGKTASVYIGLRYDLP